MSRSANSLTGAKRDAGDLGAPGTKRTSGRSSSKVNTSQLLAATSKLRSIYESHSTCGAVGTLSPDLHEKIAAAKEKNATVCFAHLSFASSVFEGEYKNDLHAEMNAIDLAIADGKIAKTGGLQISSPPCKRCACILRLLGFVTTNVTFPSDGQRTAGSWVLTKTLRAYLRSSCNDQNGLWTSMKSHFVKVFENVDIDSDGYVFDLMIAVIQEAGYPSWQDYLKTK